jgi:hypothetical protein
MARLLEVLKKREVFTAPPTAPLPREEEPMLADDTVVEPLLVENDTLPFIEIDGATRMLAGSPEVLPTPVRLGQNVPFAQKPASTASWPQAARLANACVAGEPPAATEADDSTTLAFQPWTATTGTGVAPELIAFHQPEHALSREYAQLLGRLLKGERAPQFLLFTSRNGSAAIPVLNLAISAARDGSRNVAVLGVEGADGSATMCLGLSAGANLEHVLQGKFAVEQALQAAPVAGLSVLSLGRDLGSKNAPWQHDALRWVTSWLRGRFDLIIVDAGPWEGTPNQAALASLCDAVYPILSRGAAERPETQSFLQAIVAQGGRLRGSITISN